VVFGSQCGAKCETLGRVRALHFSFPSDQPQPGLLSALGSMSSPPTAQHAPGKAAMSRALGAAFLSHQVAQLERAVANSTSNPRDSTAPRRGGGQRGRGRGAGPAPGAGTGPGPKRAAAHRAHTSDDDNRSAQLPPGLSAVVLDASVLIYAPGAVKRWCKDDNGPDLVVPLEGKFSIS